MSTNVSNSIESILSDYGHSKNAHEQAIFCCNELIDSFKNYEHLQNNPNIYIEEYFNELRNKINRDRNEKLMSVNRLFEEILDQLNELKNGFIHSKPVLDDDSEQQELSMLKEMLNEWISELSDKNLEEKRCEVINIEGKKLENALNLRLIELQTKCLLKKSIKYEPKEIELDVKGNLITLHNPAGIKRSTSLYQVIQNVQRRNSFFICNNKEKTGKKVRFLARADSQLADPPSTCSSYESSNHYIALIDYKSAVNGELSFKKGDILHIEKSDKYNAHEWFGSFCFCNLDDHQKSIKKSGTLNPQHVAYFPNLEHEPWYYGELSRIDAENYLKLDSNKTGSFLIRYSMNHQIENDKFHLYTLSVRDSNNEIRHYKIYLSKDEKNHSFYSISPKVKLFKSVKELINHFEEKVDGLCNLLTNPCQSVRI